MTNEKRLIDANALKCAMNEYMINAYDCPLNEVADFQRSTTDTKLIYAVEGLFEATEIIDDSPTVDAVEVVHGRWEDAKHAYGFFSPKCSVCHQFNKYHERYNYCPNCGAKMDGDGNGRPN